MVDHVDSWVALFTRNDYSFCRLNYSCSGPTNEEMLLPRIYVLSQVLSMASFTVKASLKLYSSDATYSETCSFLFAKLWADCMCKCWGLAMQYRALTLSLL